VQTVRLSPSAFSVLAAQGWGEEIVMHAARMLVRAGLAELSWDVQGCERVPMVVPTAAWNPLAKRCSIGVE
jgi:hypothetical protein